jgi:uncharacterized protein YxjI
MRLVIVDGQYAGWMFNIDREMVLGRADTDVLADDPDASRRHAVVRQTTTGLEVEDLGSTNGTWINGARIDRPMPLSPGDVLKVGGLSLRVEDEAAPPWTQAPAQEAPAAGMPPPQPQQQMPAPDVPPAAGQPPSQPATAAPGGPSPLLQMEQIFVRQKAHLFEFNTEYALLDDQGRQVGAVRQEGQSAAKKVVRALGALDALMTHTFSVYDWLGNRVLGLTRPRTMWKSKLHVVDGQNTPMGSIVQKKLIGKIRFDLEGPSGEPLGWIQGQNWRAWDFVILDAQGTPIGRVSKNWAGAARELFTTADNYLLEIAPQVQGPLRYLALAAGSGIDTALKQDER